MNEIKKIWKIACHYPKTYIFLIIESLITSLMKLGCALVYGQLINLVASGENINTILLYCGLSVFYVLITYLMQWHNYYNMNIYAQKVVATYQLKYIHSLFNTNYSKISLENSARYINNINNDIKNVVVNYVFDISYTINSIVIVIASFIIILTMNWKILLTMILFVIIMSILPLFIKKRLDNSILAESKSNKEYLEVLKENLLGINVVKNFCVEEKAEETIKLKCDNYNKMNFRRQKIDCAAGGLGVLIRELSVVSLIALTCYLVYIGEVMIGSVLTVFSVGQSFFSGILNVSAITTSLFSVKSLRENFFEVIDFPIIEKKVDLSFSKSLVIDNVTFIYPNRDNCVLNGINMTINKNNKYLILGKSGSGKSTILKLLANEYLPTSGHIKIDDTDYSNYTEKDINNIIAVSRQQGYLFGKTLKENIDFGNNNIIKLNEVIECCKLSDFIKRLPNGVDTILDEEINQVSGGEKLRINLARALYRDSQILLLDEVTSALDKSTSEEIEEMLLSINDKTIINVCHKFNDETLPKYDKIFVIENGKILIDGSFEEIKDNEILAHYRNISK